MNIEHPLWKGSALQLQSEFKDELDMMTEVRKYLEVMHSLEDLTTAEKSYMRLLEQWLA
jgi:hypothetical protein